jgi:hypothetical protein
VIKRNVLWISSYPKSGNTWIHSVLRVAGKRHGFPQVDMDVYNIARNKQELALCPAVDANVVASPASVLKTHAAFKPGQPLHRLPDLELENAAFIHIYRNPLDVLLSYLNFSRLEYKSHAENAEYKKQLFTVLLGFDKPYEYEEWLGIGLDDIPQANLDHALDFFSASDMTIRQLQGLSGSWLDHTRSWMDAAATLPGWSVRYEDCLADESHIGKLSSLFTFTEQEVYSALGVVNAKARSFSNTGNAEQTVFYNKMGSYYFVDYFSKPAIRRFLERHEHSLRQFGYENLLSMG